MAKTSKKANEDQEKLDDLWKDMDEDELDELDAADTPFTVPLLGGNIAAIKQLAND